MSSGLARHSQNNRASTSNPGGTVISRNAPALDDGGFRV